MVKTGILYRYIGKREMVYIKNNNQIYSISGQTFLTPDLYSKPNDAQRYLALPYLPKHRVGPIFCVQVVFDAVSLRRVRPAFGQPGGGWEISTNQPIIYGKITTF